MAPVDRKAAYQVTTGLKTLEGQLLKVGRTSDSLSKKHFILRHSALIMFSTATSLIP